MFVLFPAIGAIHIAERLKEQAGFRPADAAELVLWLLAGLIFSGLFLGLSNVLRTLRGLHASMVRLEQVQSDFRNGIRANGANHNSTAAPPAGAESERCHGLLPILQEIRDNLLLSPEQREEKRRTLLQQEIDNVRTLVHSLIDQGDLARAHETAEDLVRKYPRETWAEELVVHVERAREQREIGDVRSFARQVEDLMSISAWGRAQELVQQLLQRHPDSSEARQLLLRVQRRHRALELEQMRRLNAEIQRYAAQRRWEEALAAARTFLTRFPDSEDAAALGVQVSTLEANAEIEVRQRIEAEIMECARQGRYMEAAQLARRMVQRYPDSPQADVLRAQLDRLEELAQKPEAVPVRARRGNGL